MHLNDCASFRREKCLSFIKHQETVACEMKNQSCRENGTLLEENGRNLWGFLKAVKFLAGELCWVFASANAVAVFT